MENPMAYVEHEEENNTRYTIYRPANRQLPFGVSLRFLLRHDP